MKPEFHLFVTFSLILCLGVINVIGRVQFECREAVICQAFRYSRKVSQALDIPSVEFRIFRRINIAMANFVFVGLYN